MIKDLQKLYNERGLIISEIQDKIDKLGKESNETIRNILDRQIDDKEIELHKVIKDITRIKKTGSGSYPVIILTTPKGWTGPKEVAGKKMEGSFRAHQVPLPITRDNPENLKLLEKWLRSYHPEELFDEKGRLIPELRELCPTYSKCMGASNYANGGLLLKELKTPDWEKYAIEVKTIFVQE